MERPRRGGLDIKAVHTANNVGQSVSRDLVSNIGPFGNTKDGQPGVLFGLHTTSGVRVPVRVAFVPFQPKSEQALSHSPSHPIAQLLPSEPPANTYLPWEQQPIDSIPVHRPPRKAGALAVAATAATLALAACHSTEPAAPITHQTSPTTPASKSEIHATHPTATATPTPTESKTLPPSVGIPSRIETRDKKTLKFTMLTPDQLKEHWKEFVGKDVGLVFHPAYGTDSLDIHTYAPLESGPASHPTIEEVLGVAQFHNGDKFTFFFPYKTNQEQNDTNTVANINAFSPTGTPFPLIGTVKLVNPDDLHAYLKNFAYTAPGVVRKEIDPTGVNPHYVIEIKADPSNVNGIRPVPAH